MMRSDFIIRLTKEVKNDILRAIERIFKNNIMTRNTKGGPWWTKIKRKRNY